MTDLPALFEKVLNDCINWPGTVNAKGYPIVGKHIRVHRAVWIANNGRLRKGEVIHHQCGNKRCINPDHLECVTLGEHTQYHHLRLARRLWCRRGHLRTNESVKLVSGKLRCRACLKSAHDTYRNKHKKRLRIENRDRHRRKAALRKVCRGEK